MTLLRTFGATQGPVLKSLCLIRDKPVTDLQITQHPKSAIANRGGSAAFTVTASGTGLSYQCFQNGTPTATGPTLTVNSAQSGSAGKYAVRVTDATGGFLDSTEARLHVVSTPAYGNRPSIQVSDSRPVQGQSVTFTAMMDVLP